MGAPPGSTYSTDKEGLSGLYAALDGAMDVMRWERPPYRLSDDIDKLVVWDTAPEKPEVWQDLEDWVARGHTLIIATQNPRLKGSVKAGTDATALSAAAHPATVGVEQVSVGGWVFAGAPGDALVMLATPEGEPVLISWAHGKGRIIRSADSDWLANARIDQANNLELAMQLLQPAPGKETAFDEFHHGFQAPDRWWQILRGPLQAFVLQLAVALALVYWAYGARFGSPSPVPAGVSRAAVEYVYSVSQLYRRARAHPVVLRALHRNLLRELGRFLGGISGLSHAEVARRTADRTGLPADRVEDVLTRTDPAAPGKPTEQELIALAREAEAIQRRVQNAGYRDQRNPGTHSK